MKLCNLMFFKKILLPGSAETGSGNPRVDSPTLEF